MNRRKFLIASGGLAFVGSSYYSQDALAVNTNLETPNSIPKNIANNVDSVNISFSKFEVKPINFNRNKDIIVKIRENYSKNIIKKVTYNNINKRTDISDNNLQNINIVTNKLKKKFNSSSNYVTLDITLLIQTRNGNLLFKRDIKENITILGERPDTSYIVKPEDEKNKNGYAIDVSDKYGESKFIVAGGKGGGDWNNNGGGYGGYVKFKLDITGIDELYMEIGRTSNKIDHSNPQDGAYGYDNGEDGNTGGGVPSRRSAGGGGSTGLEADGKLIAEAGGGGGASSGPSGGSGGGLKNVGGSSDSNGSAYVNTDKATIISESINDENVDNYNGFAGLFVEV